MTDKDEGPSDGNNTSYTKHGMIQEGINRKLQHQAMHQNLGATVFNSNSKNLMQEGGRKNG